MEKKKTKLKVQAIWIAKANVADSPTKCIENMIGQYWRKEDKREKEKTSKNTETNPGTESIVNFRRDVLSWIKACYLMAVNQVGFQLLFNLFLRKLLVRCVAVYCPYTSSFWPSAMWGSLVRFSFSEVGRRGVSIVGRGCSFAITFLLYKIFVFSIWVFTWFRVTSSQSDLTFTVGKHEGPTTSNCLSLYLTAYREKVVEFYGRAKLWGTLDVKYKD